MKRFFLIAACSFALIGCATGAYRGIRIVEEGKWEFTPYLELSPLGVYTTSSQNNTSSQASTPYPPSAGIKVVNGIFERSEIGFGSFMLLPPSGSSISLVGVEAGAKFLILDEKTEADFMSLAVHGGASAPFLSLGSNTMILPRLERGLVFDLDVIAGKTFGKYKEDSFPANIYLGLGPRVSIGLLSSSSQGFPEKATDAILARLFIGGEIPLVTNIILTPEMSLLLTQQFSSPFVFLPGSSTKISYIIPNLGIGVTFRP